MKLLRRTVKSRDPELQKLLQEMIDELHALKIVSAPGVRVSRTASGTLLEVQRPTSPADGGGTVSQLRVKEVFDNHLRCRTWDGTTEGTTDISVAKPYVLRKSSYTTSGGGSTTMSINGKSFTVSAVNPSQRQLSFGGTNWQQVIHPAYNVNDVIYGAESDLTLISGSTAIKLVDVNSDARAWATRLPVCDSGVAKVMIVAGLPPA